MVTPIGHTFMLEQDCSDNVKRQCGKSSDFRFSFAPPVAIVLSVSGVEVYYGGDRESAAESRRLAQSATGLTARIDTRQGAYRLDGRPNLNRENAG